MLLRRLQSDPELVGVGAILFDEFHERNLDADLALALTADLQVCDTHTCTHTLLVCVTFHANGSTGVSCSIRIPPVCPHMRVCVCVSLARACSL